MTGNGTPLNNLLVWHKLHLSRTLAQNPSAKKVIARTGTTKDAASEERIATSTTEANAKVLAEDVVKDAVAETVVDVAVVTLVVDPNIGKIPQGNPSRHP